MKQTEFPEVSIITPTLNSERTLKLCLSSIVNQSYLGKVEIIIADGGSTDNTLKIAKEFGAKIYQNCLKTGEAGKAVGAKYATGEILAFIDSDNILPNKKWLEQLVEPLIKEVEVIASEPLFFTYRKKDHWLTRYFALIGAGDPLSLFIGNYDKYSYISNKWTELNIDYIEKNHYLILNIKDKLPTIGANGFLIRKSELKKYPVKDYLFDIDVLKFLAKEKLIKVAKVKVGIIHLFSGSMTTFIRKQRRRIKDFIYFQKKGVRVLDNHQTMIVVGVVKFILATVTLIPILLQTMIGYLRKKDSAWYFHPLACWITLLIYGVESIGALFIQQQFDRKKWSQ